MPDARIDVYLDFASLFSYVCFADLEANRQNLAANGVTIEYHPVFLGGINVASGNKPPWSLPAKASYLSYDSPRALRRVGLGHLQTPDDLMSFGMTVQPLRAIHYIKAHYPTPVFVAAFHFLIDRAWTPPNRKIADADVLREVLGEATETIKGGRKLFTPAEVDKIMDGRAAFKDSVKKETDEALAKGAFGAPWIWATNAKGESEPFFGSDRFNHVYAFLDIPFQDVKVLAPNKL
ncbi:hypothetical protein V2A60_005363 [Cordyceps javanica]|uniref:Glutathione S-transferase kappa 1 n=1 Tax=Cordyceps javanica TaxID=43265 RepID=A0A545VDY8_9HYPO|nr:glutathione S-transferase kappa 1 [Cordyceps javanica]TQW10382.1 glutathione S-transferase kappa 1 [Cordyceps javanica]